MKRRRTVVAYDIRNDKRLRAVAAVCHAYGERLQYSVFVCDLSARELVALRAHLMAEMDQRVDSIVFIDLGDERGRGTQCFEFLGARGYFPALSSRARIF